MCNNLTVSENGERGNDDFLVLFEQVPYILFFYLVVSIIQEYSQTMNNIRGSRDLRLGSDMANVWHYLTINSVNLKRRLRFKCHLISRND